LEIATLFDFALDTVIFVVGVTAVLASLGVILCSSPIYSALYLIGHMICLALLFLLYNAEFLAVVQVIVYAGAVMILFLFIIALLGGKKEVQENSFHRSMAFAFLGRPSRFAAKFQLNYLELPKPLVSNYFRNISWRLSWLPACFWSRQWV